MKWGLTHAQLPALIRVEWHDIRRWRGQSERGPLAKSGVAPDPLPRRGRGGGEGTPMIRPFFAFAMLAGLSVGGCTFAAQINGSSIAAGDARGGTISHVTTFTQPGALNMAN